MAHTITQIRFKTLYCYPHHNDQAIQLNHKLCEIIESVDDVVSVEIDIESDPPKIILGVSNLNTFDLQTLILDPLQLLNQSSQWFPEPSDFEMYKATTPIASMD